MASGIYNIQKADWMNKEVDMESDVYKIALLNNSHSFTATDTTWAAISGNEISGTGYTAGGVALANKAVTVGATTKWDADDAAWTTATFSAWHAVIYNVTTGKLSASMDLGGEQQVTSQTLTLIFNAAGIETIA